VSHSTLPEQRGFTLVEVLIAIFIGTLAVLGVYRLFSSSLRSYNLQEQLTGMYQNSTYTIKKMSELLMQAGADLPAKNYTVIYATSAHPDSFSMKVNPNGAKFTFNSDLINNDKIIIPDASAFVACDSIVRDSADTFSTIGHMLVYKIDRVKTPSGVDDTVILLAGSNGKFYAGTTIYGFNTVSYYLRGTQICYKDTMPDNADTLLADNIDSLRIIYNDKTHSPTTSWATMFSAYIYIRARTSQPDPRYKCPGFNDGYRRLPMTTEVKFRNKF
jgi:prepilin-type N-terminal cleavage/methylation domain-containing protein